MILKRVTYTAEKESWEEQAKAGRYNPATVITVQGIAMTIGAGDSDWLTVFADGEFIYVLSLNHRLGYVGLEIFDENGSQVGEVFVQDEDELKESVGPKGLEYSELTLAKRLSEYALLA